MYIVALRKILKISHFIILIVVIIHQLFNNFKKKVKILVKYTIQVKIENTHVY